jgi:hypothetical protein
MISQVGEPGEKSEHLSKNLSDSLNIYVDLFQLIDFLSMLLSLGFYSSVRVLQCNFRIRSEGAGSVGWSEIYLRYVPDSSLSSFYRSRN